MFADSGKVVMTAFISPYSDDRNQARKLIGDDFIEIFVNTSLEDCIEERPKRSFTKKLLMVRLRVLLELMRHMKSHKILK